MRQFRFGSPEEKVNGLVHFWGCVSGLGLRFGVWDKVRVSVRVVVRVKVRVRVGVRVRVRVRLRFG